MLIDLLPHTAAASTWSHEDKAHVTGRFLNSRKKPSPTQERRAPRRVQHSKATYLQWSISMRVPLALTAAAALVIMHASASAQTRSEPPAPPGAAQAQAGQNSTQAQKPGQSSQTVREKLTKNLHDAGFTDIQVMPSSFLVRAHDRDGNPVMMVINPDSVTAVTEMKNGVQSQQDNTTGHTGSSGQSAK